MNDFIEKLGTFSEEDIAILEKEVQQHMCAKDTCLLKKGEVCSSVYFVKEGAVYHHTTDKDGNLHVIDVNTTNDWVLNHKSFTSRKPSTYQIQVYEDSELYELSITSIHKLIALSPSFLQMGKLLEVVTSRLRFFDGNYTADEKYAYILSNKPELLQKFPQMILASYLKMTPETLSRVRKRVS
ncbi:Crp/Fnr family transcriptional regulator [uncultured Dokdonia sp.]|uniref:Crp/Fnr family transcriptional regulator n=1 Tax=uncultured Dokdonia sp. TaxID=575653 RepID=UPI0026190530|nr:Crp/Fnr family transcriptional regulator [uncultured Dokdonia sp.]